VSLAEQMGLRTKHRLSKATLYATLSALKRFFVWLAGQPGYKSRISYSDAEYFNLSAKETRIAKAHRDARVGSLVRRQRRCARSHCDREPDSQDARRGLLRDHLVEPIGKWLGYTLTSLVQLRQGAWVIERSR